MSNITNATSEQGQIINVSVLFFGRLAEDLGADQVTLSLPAGSSVLDVKTALKTQFGSLEFGYPVLQSLNQAIAPDSAPVTHESELAFFPPVTGG
jgi:molybdopterin converting factor small subunit